MNDMWDSTMKRWFGKCKSNNKPARARLVVEQLEPRRLLAADPVITEFMAGNRDTLADEDGQSSDWIEIFNAGDEPIDLAGWHLTDSAGNSTKWTFPSTNLDSGQYLLVFASGKDRAVSGSQLHTNFQLDAGGEYLALVEPDGATVATEFGAGGVDFPLQWRDISYGSHGLVDVGDEIPIVSIGEPASFLIPGDDAVDATWFTTGFDDGAWSTGATGFGFFQSPEADSFDQFTETDVFDSMAGVNATLYSRIEFDVDDPSSLEMLRLRMRYDDGFVAYLNGVKVAERNATQSTDPVPISLLNGSFEEPQWGTPGDGGMTYPNPPTGWTSTTGFTARYHAGTGYVDPTDGDAAFSLEGNPGVDTGLYQDLGTMGHAGEIYTFSADLLGEASWPSKYKISFVNATDGAELAAITHADFPVTLKGLPGDTVSVAMNYTALASDAGDTLRVLIEAFDDEANFYRTGVDNVDVVKTPASGPNSVGWNSTAISERSNEQAVVVEQIDLSSFLDGLFGTAEGHNVLAIHGLNLNADDPEFLLTAELAGIVSQEEIPLVSIGDSASYLVPGDDSVDSIWFTSGFDDGSWSTGPSGFGFFQSPQADSFEQLTGTDVLGAMAGAGATLYSRTEFDVDDPGIFESLELHMRYDDGFIAYLNGVQVADRNAAFSETVPFSPINGSFEDPQWGTAGDGSFDYPVAPTGWTSTTGFAARYHAGTGYADPTHVDAAFSLEGNPVLIPPAPDTGLYQDLGTMEQAGEVYTFSADLLGETSHFSKYKISFVNATDGSELAEITHDDFPVAKMGRQGDDVSVSMSYTALASDVGDTLRILIESFNDGENFYRTGVDNVDVVKTLVPDPNETNEPGWNSTATAERSNEQAVVVEQFDLSNFVDSLISADEGRNVLAIHGLNLDADDLDFLLAAELVGFSAPFVSQEAAYFITPTPGGPNGEGIASSGPSIESVFQPTSSPADSDDIVVTALVTPNTAPVDTVTLAYRVNYDAEVSLAMIDDGTDGDALAGDGIYTATIPAIAADPGDLVRWFVSAVDTPGNGSRFPSFLDPTNSPEYVGTMIAHASVTGNLPIFDWFLQPGTEGAAETADGARASAYYLGELYDNVLVHLRGNSVNLATDKKIFKVAFNQHHYFLYDRAENRVSDFALQSTGLDKAYIRPVLGFEFMRDAGVPYSVAFPMHVRRNGDFFSVALFLEIPDTEYLDRNALDPGGALYKGNLNGLTVEAQGAYRDVYSGFEKKTRKWEDNSDIVAFVQGLALTGQARTDFVLDNVDLPAVLNYMAASVIIQDADRLVNNYYFYRDTEGNGEWTFMPWDLDLSQGQHDVGLDDFHADDDFPNGYSHPFHGAQAYYQGGPPLWNKLIDVVVTTPQFREMYLRRLRTLMDEFLGAPGIAAGESYFDGRIEEWFTRMQDDVSLDKARWGNLYGIPETFRQSLDRLEDEYYAVRRTHLFQTHSIDNVVAQATVTLIEDGAAAASAFVPTGAADLSNGGIDWFDVDFVEPAGWASGTTGVGYERNMGYEGLIGLDVLSQFDRDANGTNENDSVLIRVPFSIDAGDLGNSALDTLTLRMKYDDAFVAYVNGVEVARSDNAPAVVDWNSAATTTHADGAAMTFVNFDVDPGALAAGPSNVLAIHGLNDVNAGPGTSSDLLIAPELVFSEGPLASGESVGIPNEQAGTPPVHVGAFERNPASGNQDDEYIELVNGDATAVDISGWRLAGAVGWTAAPGTVIPAGSSLYVSPDVTAFRARGQSPTGGEGLFVRGDYSGHLSNFGETIELWADDGTLVDSLTYQPDPTDVQQFLRIDEVMYNPADLTQADLDAGYTDPDQFEFIELVNTSTDTPLDLTGVRFTDGVVFDFTGSDVTSLAPGMRVLVVRDEGAMNYRYPGMGALIAGTYTGGLKNGGEKIKLDDATGSTVVEFTYKDGPKWPQAADGDGSSLVPIGHDANLNEWESWHDSVELGGSPGAAAAAAVVSRHAFHAGPDIDTAIATDKTALLPGRTASFDNVMNYSGGINGIIVDLAHAHDAAMLAIADLGLAVGNNDDPTTWMATSEAALDVLNGGGRGGSDRLVITWAANAPKNTWLEVTIPGGGGHHTTTTGLAVDDVFYFGNAVGDTGNSRADALVNAADVIAIRDNPRGPLNPASIGNPYDVNRDQRVDATDMILARDATTSPLSALRLIDLAESAAPAPMGERESTFAAGRLDSATAPSVASLDGLMAARADQPAVDPPLPSSPQNKLFRRLRGE